MACKNSKNVRAMIKWTGGCLYMILINLEDEWNKSLQNWIDFLNSKTDRGT